MAAGRKIWLHQCASPGGNVAQAFAEIDSGLAAAAAAGAVMAVFPELMLPGYNAANVQDLAQLRDGPWIARLQEMAQAAGVGVTLGYAERDGSEVFNAAVCIDATGRVLGHYRKIQLYGPREARLFQAGNVYAVFDWMGLKAALLICYDIEFAGHIRALAAQGVELILCPTANMQPFTHVVRLTVPAQAVNHGVAIAYVNYCGAEGDLTYCGGSQFVAADGRILALAGVGPEGLVADAGYVPDATLLSTQLQDYRPV